MNCSIFELLLLFLSMLFIFLMNHRKRRRSFSFFVIALSIVISCLIAFDFPKESLKELVSQQNQEILDHFESYQAGKLTNDQYEIFNFDREWFLKNREKAVEISNFNALTLKEAQHKKKEPQQVKKLIGNINQFTVEGFVLRLEKTGFHGLKFVFSLFISLGLSLTLIFLKSKS